MKLPFLISSTVIISVLSAVILYEPVSLLVFRLSEPSFGCPIKTGSQGIKIRSDMFGYGYFGAKRSGGRTHTGIDISAPTGTPVYASKSGIAFRGNVPTGYGKYVLLYHPDTTQTMYCHLSDWTVKTGQRVHKGDIIGFVGKTGNASIKDMQPHLHFEIRADGSPEDPAPKLNKP